MGTGNAGKLVLKWPRSDKIGIPRIGRVLSEGEKTYTVNEVYVGADGTLREGGTWTNRWDKPYCALCPEAAIQLIGAVRRTQKAFEERRKALDAEEERELAPTLAAIRAAALVWAPPKAEGS